MTRSDHDELEIVASGSWWMNPRVRRIQNAIIELIESSRESLIMTMSYVYYGEESASRVWAALEGAAKRGVSVYVICNIPSVNNRHGESQTMGSTSAYNELKRLASENPGSFAVRQFSGYSQAGNDGTPILHAKLVASDPGRDGASAIISSANQSDAAYLRNLEMGVQFSGPKVEEVKSMFFSLWSSSECERI